MLKKPLVQQADNISDAPFCPGDLLDLSEQVKANATVGAAALTGLDIATGILSRSGSVGIFTDTLPTAAAILAAIGGNQLGAGSSLFNPSALTNLQYQNPSMAATPLAQPGSFRWLYINLVAFIATIAVPATGGIITAGNSPLSVAVSSWREYLVSVLASKPTQVYSATTSTNTFLTNMTDEQLATLERDMSVYGTNIAANTRIASVDRANLRVVLDTATTGTANFVGVTFTPTVRFTSLRAGAI